MAPLTRCRSVEANCANDLMAEYYAQRASAGLIISEASQISKLGIGYPCTPGIHTEQQIEAWKKVTKAVHEKGGRIFLQLWHVGRVSHSSYHDDILPVAPSAIALSGEVYTYGGMKPYETPHALSVEEIQSTVADYVQGAKNAIEAGFDGVEIHGANGYLIDQFLRDGTNKREDAYGGSIENRSRFLLQIVEAVIGEIGADRTGVRLSPSGTFNEMSDSDPTTHFTYVCEKLSSYDLAYVHIIDALQGDIRHGANVMDLSKLRAAYTGTLIVCGGYDKTRADDVLSNNLADAVAFGTDFISNPDLPQRLRSGAALNEADPNTFYTQDAKGYTDYPTLS
jgi:N-ethylmaleimide reductase